jgi:hypothetical protein
MSTLKILAQIGKPPRYVVLPPEMSKTALVEIERSSLAIRHTKFATFIDSAEASTWNLRQHEVNMALRHLGEDRVGTAAGVTALTEMLCLETSLASDLVNPITAALDAE